MEVIHDMFVKQVFIADTCSEVCGVPSCGSLASSSTR
jgi:hypothetical protein